MDKKWTIRSIYMYAVSFATLMMILIGTINGLEAAFDYFFRPPDIYAPPSWETKLNMTDINDTQKLEQIQIEKDRLTRNARFDILSRIFNSLSMLGVGLPVFYLYHWRKINNKENIE